LHRASGSWRRLWGGYGSGKGKGEVVKGRVCRQELRDFHRAAPQIPKCQIGWGCGAREEMYRRLGSRVTDGAFIVVG
jgi:hypothetical protein